jgi:enterochelin esterase-like enzyme
MNLEEHIVESSSGEYSRKVWLLNHGKRTPEKMGIFLDGEYYVGKMDAPSVILRLQRSGLTPSVACVFVSHLNAQARHYDLTCNASYAKFIALDIVPWMRARNSAASGYKHFIAGTSLGGLASVYLTLTYPEVFSSCLSHSGSFWWNTEWLAKNLTQMPSSKSKFWLSVGDREIESGVSHPPTGLRQDISQVSACERMAKELNQQGHSVHYNLYKGGHEPTSWKKELPKALCWLLGKPSVPSGHSNGEQ